MDEKSELVKLTGLWSNEKNGMKYLSGYLGSAKILIFPNKYCTEDKHPKYILYIAPGKKEEKKESAGF